MYKRQGYLRQIAQLGDLVEGAGRAAGEEVAFVSRRHHGAVHVHHVVEHLHGRDGFGRIDEHFKIVRPEVDVYKRQVYGQLLAR